jgi:general secretion pathway protein D
LSFITKTNGFESVQAQVRAFFSAAGVDLTSTNKSVFFNDRKGTLMIHSTLADLDIIAAAVETLNQSPPQVNIKAKFAEITQNDNRALGFDWYLGNVLLGGGRVAASGGTQPSLNSGTPTAGNPTANPFPGNSLGTSILPAATDQLLTGGLRNQLGAPTVATFTGVLTDPQFRMAINALEQRDGTDLLTAPEITTESGRQAQIQAVDIQTIVTGVNANTGGGQNNTPAAGNGTIIQNTAPIITYPVQSLPFGPVLDVIPYVSADEYSVQMTIIPTVTEFVGYDNPGAFIPQAAVTAGSTLVAVLPLPHFRVRQVVTSAVVWDAQTIVLGGLITDSVSKVKDKVPMLGDLPLFGRFFRSESSSKTKKNLLIFVTPTIINPDGTRYHSDEEMPFAQTSFTTPKPVTQ